MPLNHDRPGTGQMKFLEKPMFVNYRPDSGQPWGPETIRAAKPGRSMKNERTDRLVFVLKPDGD
jgi:hypothetical protein